MSHRMRLRTSIAILLFATAFGLHLWWTTRGWHISGMSGHEFRQAQTAVSIWAMRDDGFRMDYSTPILGKPWSIPFEFPIYQGIVHVVDQHSHLGVVLAGRWVTLVAFYLGIPAWLLLLRRFGLSTGAALVAVLPLLFAPVYILYSRAVLIESTAFTSGAWFLYFLARYRETKRPLWLATTLVLGTVAVLTKATTWAVFCLPWVACVVADFWRARKSGWLAAVSAIVDDVLLVAAPLLVIGFGWVWFSDRIKELNPLGQYLTSSELTRFNFGTLAQRQDPKVWRALWDHWNIAVMPWWGLGLALVGAALAGRRAWKYCVLGLCAFVGAPMVFFNLYAVHDYYFYASGWGLCIAVGAVAASCWDSARRWYAAELPAFVLVALVAFGEYAAYRREFFGIQTGNNNGEFGFTQAINRVTRPRDIFVVHAPDWNSILAFRAERRALMIADSQMYYHPDDVRRSLRMLADENVPLAVFWGESRVHSDWLLERIRDLHLRWYPLFTWPGLASVYAREDVFSTMRATLEEAHIGGVELPDAYAQLSFKPPEQVAGTAAEAELATIFDPMPATVSLPYALSYRWIDGTRYLFAHPPARIEIPLPADKKKIEIGYRIEPHAYGQKDFDGAYVTLDLKRPDGSMVMIMDDFLAPDRKRDPHYRTVTLPPDAKGTLVFRTHPGSANNLSYDWVLLQYLRVK